MVNYRFLISLVLFSFACEILHDDNCITFGIEHFPAGLDPSYKSGIIEVHIYSQIYETLISLDNDYRTLIPNLAKSWSVSDDKTCFIFNLRSGVYFHDGSLFNASDAKYSIDRKIEKDETSVLAQIIKSVNIIDSLTVQVNLKYPYYQFLYSLTSPINLVIISKNAVMRYGQSISRNPIGTGPFQLTNWKENEEIKLKAFSSYWRDINKHRQVLFKVYEDDSDRERALEEAKIDILYLVTGYSIDRLKWRGTIDYYLQKPMNTIFLGFNNTNEPFNDIRLRKAIQKAIPLEKLVFNVFRGNAIVAKGPLPPSFFKYESVNQDEYNIKEAMDLLKEAGYKNGLSIRFFFPMVGFSRQMIIEILRYQLAKVGITLNISYYYNWEEHDRAIKSDSAQMFIDSYDSDVLGDAHFYLYSLFHSKSASNSLHYACAQVDQWLDEACREADAQVRQELYAKVVRQVIADVSAVFLYHVIPNFAYNRRKIKKMVANPYQIIQFHRLELYE